MVVPTGKAEPGGSPTVCAIETPPHVSVPVGIVYVTVASQRPGSLLTVIFAGQLIVGSIVSKTVITCEQVVMFEHRSVAVQVLVITSVLPQPGEEESAKDIVTVPQRSVPVAVPVFAGEVSSPHSKVIFGGQPIVGSTVSTTVII